MLSRQSSSLVGLLSGGVFSVLSLKDGLSVIQGGSVVSIGGVEASVFGLVTVDAREGSIDSLLGAFLESVDDPVLLVGGSANKDDISSSLFGEIVDLGGSQWISGSEVKDAVGSIFKSERVDIGL